VSEILDMEGLPGLERLSGVGRSLSRAIEHLVRTGRLPLLERLRGGHTGEAVLVTVAGIGRELARRIHEQLGIETLAALEMAAYDGSLAEVPGMGRKRLRSIRESLAGRFRRRPDVPSAPAHRATDLPPVAELLDVDAEYRHLAAQDRLPRIAPRRFNPTGQAKTCTPSLCRFGDLESHCLFSARQPTAAASLSTSEVSAITVPGGSLALG
jgi:DNA-binding MarR family transcriptional regulator